MCNQNRSKAQRLKITKRVVDGLAPGQTIWDSEIHGFGVRRQVKERSYVLKSFVNGRQRWVTNAPNGSIPIAWRCILIVLHTPSIGNCPVRGVRCLQQRHFYPLGTGVCAQWRLLSGGEAGVARESRNFAFDRGC